MNLNLGGFSPGIVGGGGGGSSYVNEDVSVDRILLGGNGFEPGGKDMDIPAATGIGEWDLNGRLAGYGGRGSKMELQTGCSGAVRIRLPGYFDTRLEETRVEAVVIDDTVDDDTECSSIPEERESSHEENYEQEQDEDSDDELAEFLFEPAQSQIKNPYALGSRVMVYYEGKLYNPQYPGTISDINEDGTLDIEYDDGDLDRNIRTSAVRLL